MGSIGPPEVPVKISNVSLASHSCRKNLAPLIPHQKKGQKHHFCPNGRKNDFSPKPLDNFFFMGNSKMLSKFARKRSKTDYFRPETPNCHTWPDQPSWSGHKWQLGVSALKQSILLRFLSNLDSVFEFPIQKNLSKGLGEKSFFRLLGRNGVFGPFLALGDQGRQPLPTTKGNKADI